ncbi:MAG: hypothetical protein NTW96_27615 [Planctomycetia bacterium]|nr:hypothetical protein [Planctomycetia bacterium]
MKPDRRNDHLLMCKYDVALRSLNAREADYRAALARLEALIEETAWVYNRAYDRAHRTGTRA